MSAVTPEPIMKIATGFMAAKFLFAANEIGLFEALTGGPATLGEIANRIEVPSRTTAIVTAAMVSLGLIEREGESLSKRCGGWDIPGRQGHRKFAPNAQVLRRH